MSLYDFTISFIENEQLFQSVVEKQPSQEDALIEFGKDHSDCHIISCTKVNNK